MAVPVWSVGQVLAASDVNTWFIPIVALKAIDETVASGTTLQNDDALFLPLAANATYLVRGYVFATGAALGAADIKLTFTAPSGATFRFTILGYSLSSNTTPVITAARSSGNAIHGVDGSSASPLIITAEVTTAASAGNYQLQWAQNSINATGTTVLAASSLEARRIA